MNDGEADADRDIMKDSPRSIVSGKTVEEFGHKAA